MAKHRTYSIEFKRQVAQEFLGGETLHGLGKRHDFSRNLIRVWLQKYEAGDFEDDAVAADRHSQVLRYSSCNRSRNRFMAA